MELLCGGCGGTLLVEDAAAGSEQRCPHCGRAIRVPGAAPAEGAGQDKPVTPLPEGDDLADEFLTKARLALKKKLLVVCGSCGERLTVEQRLAGNVARCPACGGQIRIPAPSRYEEPLEPEDLMTQAESPKEALDAADLSAGSGEPEKPQPTPAEPHRPPPSGPPALRAPRLARAAPKRGVPLKLLVSVVFGAMVLAGLGGLIAGYVFGRPEPPPGDGAAADAGPAAPRATPPRLPVPPELAPASPAPSAGGTRPEGQEAGPLPAPPARPEVTVVGARLRALGGDGFVPAPLGKAFLDVEVRMQAGRREARLDPVGDVVLATPDAEIRALGVAAAGAAVPTAARTGAITIPPAASLTETFVFLVPATLADGTIQVSGIGSAALPHLPHTPPPAALAIVGTHVEAGRYLKLSFPDPIMESLRAGPRHKFVARRDQDEFRLTFASLPLEAVGRLLGDGVYAVTLEQGGSRLDCHLRLVGSGRRLILYLADKPYHQIIFERQ